MVFRTDLKKLFIFLLLTGCTTGGLGPIGSDFLSPHAADESSVEHRAPAEEEPQAPITLATVQDGINSGTTLPVISSTPGTVLCNFAVFVIHVPSPNKDQIKGEDLCLQVEILDEVKKHHVDLKSQHLSYWTEIYLPNEKKWIRAPHCSEPPADWGVLGQSFEFHLYMMSGENWKPGRARDEQCPRYPEAGFAITAKYNDGTEELQARREGLTPGQVPNNFPGHILPDPIEMHWYPSLDLNQAFDPANLRKKLGPQ